MTKEKDPYAGLVQISSADDTAVQTTTEPGAEQAANPASDPYAGLVQLSSADAYSPEDDTPVDQNKSYAGDIVTGIKRDFTVGVPRTIAGLIDIVNPTDSSATAFVNRAWADKWDRDYDRELTTETQQQKANVDKAINDARARGASEAEQVVVALAAYAENKRAAGMLAADNMGSSLLTGGFGSAGAKAVAKVAAKKAAERAAQRIAAHQTTNALGKAQAEAVMNRFASRNAITLDQALANKWNLAGAATAEGAFASGATSASIAKYNETGSNFYASDDGSDVTLDGKDIYTQGAAGTWAKSDDGTMVFTPDRELTKAEYSQIQNYFAQNDPNARLNAEVRGATEGTAMAIPAGISTGLIAGIGGKVVGNVEGAIFNRAARDTLPATGWKGLLKTTGGEAAEEMAQSPGETIFENIATNKPATEGLGQDIAGSAIAGGLMGGGTHIATSPFRGEKKIPYETQPQAREVGADIDTMDHGQAPAQPPQDPNAPAQGAAPAPGSADEVIAEAQAQAAADDSVQEKQAKFEQEQAAKQEAADIAQRAMTIGLTAGNAKGAIRTATEASARLDADAKSIITDLFGSAVQSAYETGVAGANGKTLGKTGIALLDKFLKPLVEQSKALNRPLTREEAMDVLRTTAENSITGKQDTVTSDFYGLLVSELEHNDNERARVQADPTVQAAPFDRAGALELVRKRTRPQPAPTTQTPVAPTEQTPAPQPAPAPAPTEQQQAEQKPEQQQGQKPEKPEKPRQPSKKELARQRAQEAAVAVKARNDESLSRLSKVGVKSLGSRDLNAYGKMRETHGDAAASAADRMIQADRAAGAKYAPSSVSPAVSAVNEVTEANGGQFSDIALYDMLTAKAEAAREVSRGARLAAQAYAIRNRNATDEEIAKAAEDFKAKRAAAKAETEAKKNAEREAKRQEKEKARAEREAQRLAKRAANRAKNVPTQASASTPASQKGKGRSQSTQSSEEAEKGDDEESHPEGSPQQLQEKAMEMVRARVAASKRVRNIPEDTPLTSEQAEGLLNDMRSEYKGAPWVAYLPSIDMLAKEGISTTPEADAQSHIRERKPEDIALEEFDKIVRPSLEEQGKKYLSKTELEALIVYFERNGYEWAKNLPDEMSAYEQMGLLDPNSTEIHMQFEENSTGAASRSGAVGEDTQSTWTYDDHERDENNRSNGIRLANRLVREIIEVATPAAAQWAEQHGYPVTPAFSELPKSTGKVKNTYVKKFKSKPGVAFLHGEPAVQEKSDQEVMRLFLQSEAGKAIIGGLLNAWTGGKRGSLRHPLNATPVAAEFVNMGRRGVRDHRDPIADMNTALIRYKDVMQEKLGITVSESDPVVQAMIKRYDALKSYFKSKAGGEVIGTALMKSRRPDSTGSPSSRDSDSTAFPDEQVAQQRKWNESWGPQYDVDGNELEFARGKGNQNVDTSWHTKMSREEIANRPMNAKGREIAEQCFYVEGKYGTGVAVPLSALDVNSTTLEQDLTGVVSPSTAKAIADGAAQLRELGLPFPANAVIVDNSVSAELNAYAQRKLVDTPVYGVTMSSETFEGYAAPLMDPTADVDIDMLLACDTVISVAGDIARVTKESTYQSRAVAETLVCHECIHALDRNSSWAGRTAFSDAYNELGDVANDVERMSNEAAVSGATSVYNGHTLSSRDAHMSFATWYPMQEAEAAARFIHNSNAALGFESAVEEQEAYDGKFGAESIATMLSAYAANPAFREFVNKECPALARLLESIRNDLRSFGEGTDLSGSAQQNSQVYKSVLGVNHASASQSGTDGQGTGDGTAAPEAGSGNVQERPGEAAPAETGAPAVQDNDVEHGEGASGEQSGAPAPAGTSGNPNSGNPSNPGGGRQGVQNPAGGAVRGVQGPVTPASQRISDALDRTIARIPSEFGQQFAYGVKNWLFNSGLKFMQMRDIDLAAHELLDARTAAAISHWRDLSKRAAAYGNQVLTKVKDIKDALFDPLPKAVQDQVNKYLEDATLSGVWGYFEPTAWKDQAAYENAIRRMKPSDLAKHNELSTRFKALSPKAQECVRAVFAYGVEARRERVEAFKQQAKDEYAQTIANAANDKIREREQKNLDKQLKEIDRQFGDSTKPYVQLRREGSHVVIIRSQRYQVAEAALEKFQKTLRGKQVTPTDRATEAILRNNLNQMAQTGDDYIVEFVNGMGAARMRAKELEKEFGPTAKASYFAKREFNPTSIPAWMTLENALNAVRRNSTEMILDSQAKVRGAQMEQAIQSVQKQLVQMYIQSLSENSARKQELRRRKVKGYRSDMMANFMATGRSESLLLAQLKYGAKARKALSEIEDAVAEAPDKALARDFQNAVLSQHNANMGAHTTEFTQRILRANSLWSLMFSARYYVQNLTQPMMMSAPLIAGRHGGRAFPILAKEMANIAGLMKHDNAILKNGETLVNALKRTIKPEEFAALMEARNDGSIDIGITQDFGEIGAGDGRVSKALVRAMDKITGLSRDVELINRVATFLTAYRLERENGTEESALAYAKYVVEETHGDYSMFNAPVAFKFNNLARVATQFRKFQLIQAGMMLRLAKNAFVGATAEEKAIARKALMFTMGTHFGMAGAFGAPFVSVLMAGIARIFGDPDDDKDDYWRKLIGDKDIADILLYGFPKALGVEMTLSVGAGEMFSVFPFFDFRPTDAKATANELIATAIAGPTASLARRGIEGYNYLTRGDLSKGFEQLLPTGIPAGALKAWRLANEGYTTKSGNVLVNPREFGLDDKILIGLGFNPNITLDRSRHASRLFEVEKAADNRWEIICKDFKEAMRTGDRELMSQVFEDLRLENARRAKIPFPEKTLKDLFNVYNRSVKTEERTINGITTNNTNRRYVMERMSR